MQTCSIEVLFKEAQGPQRFWSESLLDDSVGTGIRLQWSLLEAQCYPRQDYTPFPALPRGSSWGHFGGFLWVWPAQTQPWELKSFPKCPLCLWLPLPQQERELTWLRVSSAGPAAGCPDTGPCLSVVKQVLLSPENARVQEGKEFILVTSGKD